MQRASSNLYSVYLQMSEIHGHRSARCEEETLYRGFDPAFLQEHQIFRVAPAEANVHVEENLLLQSFLPVVPPVASEVLAQTSMSSA
jgi:hypothetical protein